MTFVVAMTPLMFSAAALPAPASSSDENTANQANVILLTGHLLESDDTSDIRTEMNSRGRIGGTSAGVAYNSSTHRRGRPARFTSLRRNGRQRPGQRIGHPMAPCLERRPSGCPRPPVAARVPG